MFKVGKLYICEEYFLLLFPDPETASLAALRLYLFAAPQGAVTAATADAWSNRFGKPVLYAKKNIPLLSLNNKEKYVEVLAGDRKGWIIVEDWLGIKEIVV